MSDAVAAFFGGITAGFIFWLATSIAGYPQYAGKVGLLAAIIVCLAIFVALKRGSTR